MKTYQDIGELYKDKFENFAPEVPAEWWNDIQTRIVTHQSNQLLYWVGGAAALCTMALCVWLGLSDIKPAVSHAAPASLTDTAASYMADNIISPEELFAEPAAAIHSPSEPVAAPATGTKTMECKSETMAVTVIPESDSRPTPPANNTVSTQNNSAPEHPVANQNTGITPSTRTKAAAKSIFSNDTTIYSGDTVTLYVYNATHILWSTGQTGNTIKVSPSYTEQYDVSFVNEKNTDTTISIQVHCVEPVKIYVPDAFTPNGDGLNDVFEIKASQVPASYSITITNASSQKLFSTNNITTSWDGTFYGQDLPHGVYYYHISYTDNLNKTHHLKGDILLIRQ